MLTLNSNQTMFDVASAYHYCLKIAATHEENFPIISFFIDEKHKRYLSAIYAFARQADDIADNAQLTSSEKLAALLEWQKKLLACYNQQATDPIFIALCNTVQACQLSIKPFLALLQAFNQDAQNYHYKTYAELLDYAKHSANPVGRIVLMVFGYHDEKLFNAADAICTGLQLIDFWQDLAIDSQNKRFYIPDEILLQFSYTQEELLANQYNANFKKMMAHLVMLAEAKFTEGETLFNLIDHKKLAIHLKLVLYGGKTIASKIKQINYNIFNDRPRLSLLDKLLILSKALFK